MGLARGSHCYPENIRHCPGQQVGNLPIGEYEHGDNGCAVIGIGVYRGDRFPTLNGVFFHSDFCTGKIWSLQRSVSDSWRYVELLDLATLALGSGRDAEGNLYLTTTESHPESNDDSSDNRAGAIWRLVAADSVPGGAMAAPVDEP